MMEECKPLALVQDVEEGEISDSASSVEEISEEAFIKGPQPPASAVAAVSAPPLAQFNYNSSSDSSMQKVWTMRDLYKYQLSSNYSGAGLYNLAWASAVQNKPLDDVLEMEYPNSSLKRDGAASGAPVSSNVEGEAEDEKVDEEREDGELEEGEIDFDSPVMMTGENLKEDKQQAVDVIKKGLESVTMEEAVKSLDEVCSRMHNLLDSVQELPDQDLLTGKHDIAALAFSAIEMVFCSMNRVQKIFQKDMMLRLLAHASNLTCGLFSAQQLNEIEAMICDLDSLYISLGCEDAYSDEEMKELDTEEATGLDSVSVELSDNPPPQTSAQEDMKLDNSKWRGSSVPLLDLHKDHDADSLPSPTRGGPACVPSEKGLSVGYGLLKPEWPVPRVVIDSRRDSVPMHPYETDAVKAVSSYQQKFGRSSFFMHDRLPSPTPSDDGDAGDGDISGEISSSSNMNVNLANTSLPCLSSASSPPKIEITSSHAVTNAWNDPQSSNGPNPPLKTSSARSRDPRLRLAHSDVSAVNGVLPVVNREHKSEPVGSMISSRKQKNVEDLVFDGPAFKRQRSDEVVTSSQGVTGTGGWLEDRGIASVGLSNKSRDLRSTGSDPRIRPEFAAAGVTGVTSGSSLCKIAVDSNANIPATTSSAAANLHSLLKEITDNPSKFMDRFKMEQQKSASLFQMTTQPIVSIPSTGAFASAGALLTTPQISTVERMKPRDPRRVLHSGTFPKGGNMELNQSLAKTSAPGTPGIVATMNSQRQDGLLDNKSTASHSVAPPNIAGQFTQSLKNIADIVSVSQATVSEPVTPHITSSAPVQAQQGRTGIVTTSGLGSLQNVSVRDGKASSVSSQPQNDWHDVQHLFNGFDDRQKAAIHKERARRLAEQKKMFAGQKLCLVLDLDHTLLNSAKYAEVDPVDDEKLRQKEEQEREKSHRHLFRFPHMAMWTKLRPGIWNFLERVSKLFELHLYTMGNKLYATEMAKLLDPKGELFAGRVISRGDDTDLLDGDERVPKIKDLEGVMGMESSVLIIDDSVRVWPHHKLNLIAVERYIYFPCSRRQFGLPGPSLLEIDHDERPEDGTLASCLGVIERIHETFFSHKSLDEADVRNILASEQRKILSGCRVCFSRIIPVAEANPHLHPLWQTAEQFGAVCTNTIDEKVTHVVANSGGTDKVHWARNNNRFVVYPGWIEASALLYRRANEVDFTIKL